MEREKAQIVAPIVANGRTYFTTEELGCRCSFCQGRGKLAEGFARMLLDFRLHDYGMPMPLTSAARCREHNAAVGGAPGSYHIYETDIGTCAVDVTVPNSIARADLIAAALGRRWRVGINKDFIHLDAAPLYYRSQTRRVFFY